MLFTKHAESRTFSLCNPRTVFSHQNGPFGNEWITSAPKKVNKRRSWQLHIVWLQFFVSLSSILWRHIAQMTSKTTPYLNAADTQEQKGSLYQIPQKKLYTTSPTLKLKNQTTTASYEIYLTFCSLRKLTQMWQPPQESGGEGLDCPEPAGMWSKSRYFRKKNAQKGGTCRQK